MPKFPTCFSLSFPRKGEHRMGLRSGVEKSREKEPGDHHSKAAGRGRGYFKGQAVTVGAGEGANGRARGPRRRGRLALWGAITKKHKYSGRKEGWRRQTPIHPTPTRRLLLWVKDSWQRLVTLFMRPALPPVPLPIWVFPSLLHVL